MTLHARVSRVDDYTGELIQALTKLEIEHSRGALDRDQQADFLADLWKAMELRDLLPMRNRTVLDLLFAASTLLVALMLPKGLSFRQPSLIALLVLCTASLGMAGWRLNLYVRRLRHDRLWFNRLKVAVDAGRTIFDAR